MLSNDIIFQVEEKLSPEEFKSVLIRSTLGERRPIEDNERLEQMCKHANIIVTARKDGQLIGIARSLTDFGFCTYLSDLAVDVAYQKMGIGKKMIEKTQAVAAQTTIILLAAPAARAYYPKIGMTQFEYCFIS